MFDSQTQVLSSIIGVLVRLALAQRVPWLANALGMSLALVAMQVTTTTHPPGECTVHSRSVLSGASIICGTMQPRFPFMKPPLAHCCHHPLNCLPLPLSSTISQAERRR